MLIKEVKARKIKDSRNEPTIEVSVNNKEASSPSGRSTGKYETQPYHKSIDWNIKAINNLKIPFEINSFEDLEKVENYIIKKFKLKDTKQFGANALFTLESAILKALAKENKKQLWQIINPAVKKLPPIPIGNAIGGGLHSHNSQKPEFQEFLIIPKSKSINKNYNIMKKTYKKLKYILKSNKTNDEGALETSLSIEGILSLLSEFKNIKIGIDAAASSFYKNKHYFYNKKSLIEKYQISYINNLIKNYNLFYIEDPLQEEDFEGFAKIKKSSKNLVVGDDLTATQIPRLKRAISSKAINAMIIKPNQNGSLIELQKIFKICKKNKIKTILSHRSGETLDNSLADYATAFEADYIKTGIATKWREIKLKRLIEIEEILNKQ